MSTLTVQNIQGSSSSGNTISVASGHVIHQPGTVLQCQNVYVTDRTSQSIAQNQTASSATNITGMTLNVTPKFANSKMIIQARWCGEFSSVASAGWNNMFVIQRDNVPIGMPTQQGNRTRGHMPASMGYYANDNDSTLENCMWDTVDFPNTTSQVTYTAGIYSGWATGYTLYNNRTVNSNTNSGFEDGTSSIVVWEIAA